MGRPRRIHFPGAFYHLTVRGNNKERIFFDDWDRRYFLKRVKMAKKQYNFQLFSYNLMPNHVHVYLQIDVVPLSKIMQSILISYSKTINQKYGRTGHLFQGRYFAKLVDSDSYSLELVRYIDTNPVKAGLVDDPAEYRWGSHRAYLGLEKDELVNTEFILRQFADDLRKARRLYREFVGRISDWDAEQETRRENGILLLGSNYWISKIIQSVPDIDRNLASSDIRYPGS